MSGEEPAPRAEYAILADQGVGLVRYAGEIEAGGIIRLAGALWADPAWEARYDVIVDLLEARMTITPDERRRLASFLESYPLASRGRLVHVVGAGSLEYSRMSEETLPGEARSFARVSTLREAIVFLFGAGAAPAVEGALRAAELKRVDFDGGAR